jgi:lipid-A-disaccharide synthase
MTSSVDILILSNGPGEVTTWVRPVVKALREQLGHDISQVRISVILSPCPHASGKEAAIALGYPEVDRVQAAADFWQFLLWGKTAENWDWRNQGAVVFLGGDQLFPVLIGKKLGYKTVVYAEWSARWHNFIDKFAIMKAQVAKNVSPKYIDKFTVVGDLMLEAAENEITSKIENPKSQINIIGILPGSKAAKLTQGVPLTLAIAEYIHSKLPQTKFFIPVAPTLDLSTLADFAKAYAPSSDKNNPAQYTANLANHMKVRPDARLQDLDTGKWAEAVAQAEGYKGKTSQRNETQSPISQTTQPTESRWSDSD